MTKTIARPNKVPGRVVVGPRQVEKGYARIVACDDGSGRIELYDANTRTWSDAAGECTFSELWTAPAAFVESQSSSNIRVSEEWNPADEEELADDGSDWDKPGRVAPDAPTTVRSE